MLYYVILYPLELIFEIIFYSFNNLVQNYGYAILCLSLVVQIITLPLYMRAEKWQKIERDTQNTLKSKVTRIKQAFKGDEQYMILSTYYKQQNYHPIYALRSTIGLLIQIPFFIAAYNFISHLEILQGSSFFFIQDLSKPDNLFLYNGIYFNILPIVMTAINILGTVIYTKGFQLREKLQLYVMALVFLVLLYNSSAGLVLYWTMNNVFSILKNLFAKMTFPKVHLDSKLKFFFDLDTIKTKHFALFIASTLGLFILAALFIPSELLSSSPQEFSFLGDYISPMEFIEFPLMQCAGIFIFWIPCLYGLCSKNGRKLFSIVLTSFFLCALINTFFLSGNFERMSSALQLDADYEFTFSAINIFIDFSILLVSLIITFLLIKFSFSFVLTTIGTISCVLLLVLSIQNYKATEADFSELYARMEESGELDYRKSVGDIEPFFNFSKTEENVLIIMLDRGISGFIPYIFEQSPDIKKQFDGFTFYPNTLSPGCFTLFGLPAIFGGYEYLPHNINKRVNETLVEKHNEALSVLPVLFLENDYSVTISDPTLANYSWIPDTSIFDEWDIKVQNSTHRYTEKWLHDKGQNYEENITLDRDLLFFSFFRIFPQSLRHIVYDNGKWLDKTSDQIIVKKEITDLLAEKEAYKDLVSVDPLYTGFIGEYSVLDYLPELTATTAEKKTFGYICNDTTHDPRFLQYPDYEPVQIVTDKGPLWNNQNTDIHYHVNIASLKKLGEYFDYLRQENVYDNTKIIVVSDHGTAMAKIPEFASFWDTINPPRFNSILLVKDFNSNDNIKTNMEFMNIAEVPALVTKDLIDNPRNPFTGNVLQSEKGDAFTVYASVKWNHADHNENTFILDNGTWQVTENIFNPANWTKIK